jgi:hypothetical protein
MTRQRSAGGVGVACRPHGSASDEARHRRRPDDRTDCRGEQARDPVCKRDAAHVAAGYRVIRFTADQLEHEPLIVIGQLSAALALALAS